MNTSQYKLRHLCLPMIVALSLLAIPSYVFAHGSEKHKGDPVEGTILSVSSSGLALQTEDGKKDVIINDQTLFEKDGNKASREKVNFEVGQKTQVFGTKLPGGKIVAAEIVVQASSGAHKQHQGMKKMDHQMQGEKHDKMMRGKMADEDHDKHGH